ncbi:MAG: tetratricopeptide repeat protein, partial [Pseudomonadota bacterium]
ELRSILQSRIDDGGGRLFSTAGDGFLVEFGSPVQAVRCGFEIQRDLAALRRRNKPCLELRIGVHLADIVVEEDNLMGDGINVASRIEKVAETGSVTLSEAVFQQVKRTAQLTFADLGEHSLKNISEPVRLYRVLDEMSNHSFITGTPELVAAGSAHPPNNASSRASIVILPFTSISEDAEQQYFATGFCEDIITELSRFTDMSVVSRNASFAYQDRQIDPRQVGIELGVRYCLAGSVRKLASRIRITTQLIGTETGDHVWGDRFDCDLNDVFDVQDQIVARIVSMVFGRIEGSAAAAARRKRPADMGAYDCFVHGMEFHRSGGVTREYAQSALQWFEKAIEMDPLWGRAHAWRACARATLGEWDDDPDWWDDAIASATRALELDDNEAESHRILGSIHLYSRSYEKAEYHFLRALALNPNHAYIVGQVGELYNFLGDGEKALEFQKRARMLDPSLPAYCRELEAVANYMLERYAETARVVGELNRVTRRAAVYRAAALRHLEDRGALERAVSEVLRIDPVFSTHTFLASEYYRDRTLRDRIGNDLEAAGLPD